MGFLGTLGKIVTFSDDKDGLEGVCTDHVWENPHDWTYHMGPMN